MWSTAVLPWEEAGGNPPMSLPLNVVYTCGELWGWLELLPESQQSEAILKELTILVGKLNLPEVTKSHVCVSSQPRDNVFFPSVT